MTAEEVDDEVRGQCLATFACVGEANVALEVFDHDKDGSLGQARS